MGVTTLPLGWELNMPSWGTTRAVARAITTGLWTGSPFSIPIPRDLVWCDRADWTNTSCAQEFTVALGPLTVRSVGAPPASTGAVYSFNVTRTAGSGAPAPAAIPVTTASITGYASAPGLYAVILTISASGFNSSTGWVAPPPTMPARVMWSDRNVTLRLLVAPCRSCPWGTRPTGVACVQGGNDTGCEPCTACAAGSFESTPCAPDSATAVPGCTACTTPGACVPGVSYLGKACSRYADAACMPCSEPAAACPAPGAYALRSCNATHNVACGRCSDCGCGGRGVASCEAGSGPGSTGAGCVCACKPGFTGAACDACADPRGRGVACDVCQCSEAGTVGGASGCSANGTCPCALGFTGARCDRCASGWYGPACAGVCGCSPDHGRCDGGVNGTGGCSCSAGWGGSACDVEGGTPAVAGGSATATRSPSPSQRWRATGVVAGTPPTPATATQGRPFSLPLPAHTFRFLPGGENASSGAERPAGGVWTLALVSGPPWVAVVFDPAAPANYSVVGTPGRAHVTRGGRRSGAAAASAARVVVGGVLAGSGGDPAAAPALARVGFTVDVAAANTPPTLTPPPQGRGWDSVGVGGAWGVEVGYGTGALAYRDADVDDGFDEALLVTAARVLPGGVEAALPSWLTFVALPTAAGVGTNGSGGPGADVAPRYRLAGVAPLSAAGDTLSLCVRVTDAAGANASVTLPLTVNASFADAALAFALPPTARRIELSGGVAVGGDTLGPAPASNGVTPRGLGAPGANASWPWVMPDAVFRVGGAAPWAVGAAVAVPALTSYTTALLTPGPACAWLRLGLALLSAPSSGDAYARPLPRPVLSGVPPAQAPGSAPVECAVAVNATNAGGFSVGGVVVVAVRAGPVGVSARPGVSLAPLARSANEGVAGALDASTLFAFNESIGVALTVVDARTGKPAPPALAALWCGDAGSTRGGPAGGGDTTVAAPLRPPTSVALVVTGAGVARCVLASGSRPFNASFAIGNASFAAGNDTAPAPGLYNVALVAAALDGAPAASGRATARVLLGVRVLPPTQFSVRVGEWG